MIFALILLTTPVQYGGPRCGIVGLIQNTDVSDSFPRPVPMVRRWNRVFTTETAEAQGIVTSTILGHIGCHRVDIV